MLSNLKEKVKRYFLEKSIGFKILGAFLLIVVGFMIIQDFKIYQRKQDLKNKVEVYKKQIEDIKKSTQNLKNEIANSNSIDYLEKMGYEKFAKARPGETEYMFIKEKIEKEEVVIVKKNFWQSFTANISNAWNWIKNKF